MASYHFPSIARYAALAVFLSTAIASPIGANLDASALHRRSGLPIIKTTVTPSGQIIDWVPIESQVDTPLPSVQPFASGLPFIGSGPISELLLPGVEVGPAGTVPIPRMSEAYLANPPSKKAPPAVSSPAANNALERRDNYAGVHWYVNAAMQVTQYGSQAIFSLFKAFTQSQYDFSLLQTAVAQTNAQMPGDPSRTTTQTAEAGWINFPWQVSQPHLFTYYTVNGYGPAGDYLGCWNTDCKGWAHGRNPSLIKVTVQLSSTYYPGVVLTPLSQIGGTQDEIQLTYHLNGGNWYLEISGGNVQAQIMGYYPASLYSNHTQSGATTLANSSNEVAFYGEIEQTETALTTTDMGSGKFGAAGYTQSAYMRNMIYLDQAYNNFAFTGGFYATNSSMYNYGHGAAGGNNWGNYIYLGGPGAGGVVGG